MRGRWAVASLAFGPVIVLLEIGLALTGYQNVAVGIALIAMAAFVMMAAIIYALGDAEIRPIRINISIPPVGRDYFATRDPRHLDTEMVVLILLIAPVLLLVAFFTGSTEFIYYWFLWLVIEMTIAIARELVLPWVGRVRERRRQSKLREIA
jgi:hypothetical protein